MNQLTWLYPVVIMKPNSTTRCVFICAPATHPVGASIRQVVVVRFRVPAAKRHISPLILPLALLAGIIAIEGVLVPPRVCGTYAVGFDQGLKVMAGAFEGCKRMGRQVAKDIDHDVVWKRKHILPWFQKPLDLKANLEEVMGHMAIEAAQRRIRTIIHSSQWGVWPFYCSPHRPIVVCTI